jgi:hypothetical protein
MDLNGELRTIHIAWLPFTAFLLFLLSDQSIMLMFMREEKFSFDLRLHLFVTHNFLSLSIANCSLSGPFASGLKLSLAMPTVGVHYRYTSVSAMIHNHIRIFHPKYIIGIQWRKPTNVAVVLNWLQPPRFPPPSLCLKSFCSLCRGPAI